MLDIPFLAELRNKIREKNNAIATRRLSWIESNRYYYRELLKHLRYAIPEGTRLLHVRSSVGYLLGHLAPAYGVGVDDSEKQVEIAQRAYPQHRFLNQSVEALALDEKFDHILITSPEDIIDVKAVLDGCRQCADRRTRVVIVSYNNLWNPLVRLAEAFRLKIPQRLHNWIDAADLDNILVLSQMEPIVTRNVMLFPFYVPLVSSFLNRIVARLPLFRSCTLLRITVARFKLPPRGRPSVSVIVPCRNEAGNIRAAVERIPALGSDTEIIFGDDKSTDGTPDVVRRMIAEFPEKNIRLIDSPGICKADNVWTCFDQARGDILMILDADLTVPPEELPYFYDAISSDQAEFINGSRFVYPMHDEAMRLANVIGNKFFSMAFSFILDTRIKDTLCGTKVMWRDDFARIRALRNTWGIKDRWGDYELLFSAAKNHLKIIDLPVHYLERTYGETKMTARFSNGLVMLRMCRAGLAKIKFY